MNNSKINDVIGGMNAMEYNAKDYIGYEFIEYQVESISVPEDPTEPLGVIFLSTGHPAIWFEDVETAKQTIKNLTQVSDIKHMDMWYAVVYDRLTAEQLRKDIDAFLNLLAQEPSAYDLPTDEQTAQGMDLLLYYRRCSPAKLATIGGVSIYADEKGGEMNE